MNIVDNLLNYLNDKDKTVLITTDIQISSYELNVVVIKILSWLKLEYKRSLWIAEGKKSCYKPLDVDIHHSWGTNLHRLIEKEKVFYEFFSIKDGKFDFLDTITEEERAIAREKAYQNYNPQKHS